MTRPVIIMVAAFLAVAVLASGAIAQKSTSKGIGPVKELKLGPVDPKTADAGRQIFDKKCSVCHALDGKKLGPPLRDVTARRTPEWIMNMLLNVKEMLASDPEAGKMSAEYKLPMPDQQLTRETALQLLEYLRQAATEKK